MRERDWYFLVSFIILLFWFFLSRLAAELPESLAQFSATVKKVGLTELFDSVDRGLLRLRNIILLLSVCAFALGLNALVLNWRKAG